MSYEELRANCERIAAERHKNPAPYDREAVLARQTLGLLDKLEALEKLVVDSIATTWTAANFAEYRRLTSNPTEANDD